MLQYFKHKNITFLEYNHVAILHQDIFEPNFSIQYQNLLYLVISFSVIVEMIFRSGITHLTYVKP